MVVISNTGCTEIEIDIGTQPTHSWLSRNADQRPGSWSAAVGNPSGFSSAPGTAVANSFLKKKGYTPRSLQNKNTP
eukprot:COSAG02_NODE_1813_length_10785_cov_17.017312_1_plen_76_part_00